MENVGAINFLILTKIYLEIGCNGIPDFFTQIHKKKKMVSLLSSLHCSFSVFFFFSHAIVTTKVTQGAKNFGSFLYSAVNKASSKIKETVKDNVSSAQFFLSLPYFRDKLPFEQRG